jgi:hypothetical protein
MKTKTRLNNLSVSSFNQICGDDFSRASVHIFCPFFKIHHPWLQWHHFLYCSTFFFSVSPTLSLNFVSNSKSNVMYGFGLVWLEAHEHRSNHCKSFSDCEASLHCLFRSACLLPLRSRRYYHSCTILDLIIKACRIFVNLILQLGLHSPVVVFSKLQILTQRSSLLYDSYILTPGFDFLLGSDCFKELKLWNRMTIVSQFSWDWN